VPRRSPFVVKLARDERAALEARARKYTCPYRDVIRAKIVLLAAMGLRNDMIGARLNVPRQIVSKWRKRFFHDRLAGLDEEPRGGRRARFSPSVVVEVKRLACEAPRVQGVPLARWSIGELQREAVTRGVVATISGTTVWRWLAADAIRPWRHRTWLFPRDPAFAAKAGPILDLHAGLWDGQPLAPNDCVLSADEKTSIQARRRRHPSLPPRAHQVARVEHEYARMGAWAYLAAWDVRRATLFGRCELRTGIAAFDRLVAQVMAQEPHRSAPRVFWIMDNGSGHRGQKAVARLQAQWPTLIPVFTPIHASWLNQIEIYFSIVQRKVLTPTDFADLAALEATLLAFQSRYEAAAHPFEWTFTRQDLVALLARLALAEHRPAA